MSTTNILLCTQRLLLNIFKSPILRKHHVILSSNYSVKPRFISNAAYHDKLAGKELTEKSEHNMENSIRNRYNNRAFNEEGKDSQLSDDHNPDIFGTLDKNFLLERKLEELPEEEGDVEETIYYDEKREQKGILTINKYGKIIKYFLNKKKLGNAINVLETRMLKEDKVKPDTYIYNLLMSGCAQYGYTQKAFQLFNQMKKRGLKPTASTYTSLFNACSSSPWTHDGLKRVKRLRMLMLEKGYIPNQKNYHAMIKAYSRCNDLESAFTVVDEMIEKNILVTNETFNFLLQACISDNEAGLRHAILVWNKMLSKGLKPDLYSFNLILRCTRDCGLGSLEATADVIKAVTGYNGTSDLLESSIPNKQLSSNDSSKSENIKFLASIDGNSNDSLFVRDDSVENRPNLLSRSPHLGDIIGLTEITLPHHRLILFGGCEGFLREMELNNIKPDIKTFTQLLEVIPSTLSAEQSLLHSLFEHKIQVDIDFFNILIKKRSMRQDFANAKDVLKLIQKQLLTPDIVTFGVLALSCCTQDEADQLIKDMDEIGYRMNIEILGALLRNAIASWDIDYIVKIMRLVLDENITPSPQFMTHLWQFYSSVLKFKEINGNEDTCNLSEDDKKFIDKINDAQFMDQFKHYCIFFKKWRSKALPEAPVHPYAQFRKHHEDPEDVAVMNTGRSSY